MIIDFDNTINLSSLIVSLVRPHDDTGDGHDMHTEVDEWDLRDLRRETTRVQNRRNVALGSLHDQPKPLTGKDGFFLHVRLGLVWWITY